MTRAGASALKSGSFIAFCLFLSACDEGGEGDRTVFSSRTSPNGLIVAESAMMGDGSGGGQISLRSKQGRKARVDLSYTTPDLFIRWIDDQRLELWSERRKLDISKFDGFDDVEIIAKSYEFPQYRGRAFAYTEGASDLRKIAIPAENVVATFADRAAVNLRYCDLMIGTKPDPAYESASVEITAAVARQDIPRRSSGGVETRFSLQDQSRTVPQSILTSATVSDIPSYNQMPTGADGTSVRGQFIADSASALISAIKSGSISLDFSRDFFNQVIRYEIALSTVSQPVTKFIACVGEADMAWMYHRP